MIPIPLLVLLLVSPIPPARSDPSSICTEAEAFLHDASKADLTWIGPEDKLEVILSNFNFSNIRYHSQSLLSDMTNL